MKDTPDRVFLTDGTVALKASADPLIGLDYNGRQVYKLLVYYAGDEGRYDYYWYTLGRRTQHGYKELGLTEIGA